MSVRATQHPGFCSEHCRVCERDEHERDQAELEHPTPPPPGDADRRWCEERDR